MKKNLGVLAVLSAMAAFAYFNHPASGRADSVAPVAAEQQLAPTRIGSSVGEAWEQRRSDVQVLDEGTVRRLLADDTNGSRHQRFILAMPSGQTVLVAHNIDLAPRIDTLAVGDTVAFYGEYEWNEKGGVVHWTHRDHRGSHPHGWLRHKGKTYQ